MSLLDLVNEAVERIALPLDEFRAKYAPGSIETHDTYPSFDDARMEMQRQIAKWGIQNHVGYTPDGVLSDKAAWYAAKAKAYCDRKADVGTISWTDILLEEVFEAIEEAEKGDLEKLDTELVQCIAVIQSWRQSIKRNKR